MVCLNKVDVPNSNMTMIWTPLFEWYVEVRRGSKKRFLQNYMCLKEIKPCAKNMLTTLGSKSTKWGCAMSVFKIEIFNALQM